MKVFAPLIRTPSRMISMDHFAEKAPIKMMSIPPRKPLFAIRPGKERIPVPRPTLKKVKMDPLIEPSAIGPIILSTRDLPLYFSNHAGSLDTPFLVSRPSFNSLLINLIINT